MNEHLETIKSEKRKQPTEEDLEDDLINSSCNNYEASFLKNTSKIYDDFNAKDEEEENLIEKTAKRFKQETSCVTINNEMIEIVTLKLPQLKEQLKIRGVKIEGNKEKLFSKLKEVSFIFLCFLYKYKNLI
jgi:hypothetical protein